MRLLPELTDENRPYWTGGAQGQLLIARCDACAAAIHPPELICPRCLSREIVHRPASGTGAVYTFTINTQAWRPDLSEPYAIVVVDLDGEDGVRITGELVGDAVLTPEIGDRVRTVFLAQDDVWIPQFVLDRAPSDAETVTR